MSYSAIVFERLDGVARITLSRPEKLNSFTGVMHDELRDAFDRIDSDPTCRCLLITGAGRGFCAGQDLADCLPPAGEGLPDLGEAVDKNYNPLIRRIRALGVPVVCAVNGVAAGAGVNLALACDIVLAARSASFIQAFCRIGLVPDSGGSWFLPRLVGMARASALSMLGEKIGAEQAEAWGMIWRCVDDGELEAEALALARHLAVQPTRTLALIKQALNRSATSSLDDQLDLERDLQRKACETEDFAEGLTAFLDKRAPVFNGR